MASLHISQVLQNDIRPISVHAMTSSRATFRAISETWEMTQLLASNFKTFISLHTQRGICAA